MSDLDSDDSDVEVHPPRSAVLEDREDRNNPSLVASLPPDTDPPEGPAFVVISRVDGTSIRPCNPFKLNREMRRLCRPEVKWAKPLKSGSLLVHTTDADQSRVVLGLTSLLGKPVKAKLADRLTSSQGTVHAPDKLSPKLLRTSTCGCSGQMAESLNVPESTAPEAEPAGEMLTSSCYGYECFQNYTAPEVFIQGLAGTVSTEDTEAIIRAQKVMLQRFEKTNAMLTNCNALSAQRLQNTTADFKKHVQMLTEMKKDLNQVFERIRKLKTKLANQYPKQFAEAANRTALPEEDDDEETATGAVGGAAAPPAGGAVRRRERSGRQSREQQQLKRHSYHASVAESGGGGSGGGGSGGGGGSTDERAARQLSEPPPHSSSDSDGEEEPSVSSTNS